MYCALFLIYFIIKCISISCHNEDLYTIKYTIDNFDKELPKKHHFIMFYAPWCGHCQRLSPVWEQLAEMLNEDDNDLKIAKVDCTTDSKICSDQDITGYPTLKFFKMGKTEGVKFRGVRDLPTLTTFINHHLRKDDDNLVTGPIELYDETFEKHVSVGKHFVQFYVPWCGHCLELIPIWIQLKESFDFDESISISKLDCYTYSNICTQFEIKSYPTLLWIEDGKKIDEFGGEFTHEELKLYVDKMMGSNVSLEPGRGSADSDGNVGTLNASNFKENIKRGTTVVVFYAPWCGHCKRFAPTWEELKKKFSLNKNLNLVKVDCTMDINKSLCRDQSVQGFPTIYLYKNGKKLAEYNGSRTLDDLYDFIKEYIVHDEL